MKSPVVKRSIVIAGHKTSVSLEDAFWKGLKDIAIVRNITLSDLVASIDSGRAGGNLSSAIRLFVLDHYRAHPEDASREERPRLGVGVARGIQDAFVLAPSDHGGHEVVHFTHVAAEGLTELRVLSRFAKGLHPQLCHLELAVVHGHL